VASGRALPRTHAFKFQDGLREERLCLEAARLQEGPPHGGGAAQQSAQPPLLLLADAVLECVYDGVRVVHRGALRVAFSANLKARSMFY